MNRRTLLLGLGAALAAPAIIRTPGLLMAVRPLQPAAPLWGVSFGPVQTMGYFHTLTTEDEQWLEAFRKDHDFAQGILWDSGTKIVEIAPPRRLV